MAYNPVVYVIVLIVSAYFHVVHGGNSCSTYNNPKVSQETGDVAFAKCCKANPKIPAECRYLCKYESTVNEVAAAYRSGKCDDPQMLEPIVHCANGGAKGSDNRQCCKDCGVTPTFDDPICSNFCAKSPKIGEVTNQMLWKCGRRLNLILKCHLYGLKP